MDAEALNTLIAINMVEQAMSLPPREEEGEEQ